jgi:hypothetical protein
MDTPIADKFFDNLKSVKEAINYFSLLDYCCGETEWHKRLREINEPEYRKRHEAFMVAFLALKEYEQPGKLEHELKKIKYKDIELHKRLTESLYQEVNNALIGPLKKAKDFNIYIEWKDDEGKIHKSLNYELQHELDTLLMYAETYKSIPDEQLNAETGPIKKQIELIKKQVKGAISYENEETKSAAIITGLLEDRLNETIKRNETTLSPDQCYQLYIFLLFQLKKSIGKAIGLSQKERNVNHTPKTELEIDKNPIAEHSETHITEGRKNETIEIIKENIGFLGGYYTKKESVMSESDFEILFSNLENFIESGQIPEVNKIDPLRIINTDISHSFYRLKKQLNKKSLPAELWAKFIKASFKQFEGTKEISITGHWKKRPLEYYERIGKIQWK